MALEHYKKVCVNCTVSRVKGRYRDYIINIAPFGSYPTNNKSRFNVCPCMALYWIDVLEIVPIPGRFLYCVEYVRVFVPSNSSGLGLYLDFIRCSQNYKSCCMQILSVNKEKVIISFDCRPFINY